MSFLPKIKKCPSCDAINLIKINGVSYENKFSSLYDWTLKKIFNCRKCKIELGLFFHINHQNEKLIWLEYLKCEDSYFNTLLALNIMKNKNKKCQKKFNKASKEIEDIQNQIRLEQTKLKIKCKIQKKGMLIRHVY